MRCWLCCVRRKCLCADNYFLKGASCVADCGSGYYKKGNTCVTSCGDDYLTQGSECVTECDKDYLQKKNTCINSADGCGDWYVAQNGECVPNYEQTEDGAIVIDDDMEPITEDIFGLEDSNEELEIICRGDVQKCEDILSLYPVPIMLDMSGVGGSGNPKSVGGSGNPGGSGSGFPVMNMVSADSSKLRIGALLLERVVVQQ